MNSYGTGWENVIVYQRKTSPLYWSVVYSQDLMVTDVMRRDHILIIVTAERGTKLKQNLLISVRTQLLHETWLIIEESKTIPTILLDNVALVHQTLTLVL